MKRDLASELRQGWIRGRRMMDQRAPWPKGVRYGYIDQMATGHVCRCALGESRRRCVFAPLREQVTIAQNMEKYCPIETRLDEWLRTRCGAKTIAQSHVTIKVDPTVPRACGRKGCAEQSIIARTLYACTPSTWPH